MENSDRNPLVRRKIELTGKASNGYSLSQCQTSLALLQKV